MAIRNGCHSRPISAAEHDRRAQADDDRDDRPGDRAARDREHDREREGHVRRPDIGREQQVGERGGGDERDGRSRDTAGSEQRERGRSRRGATMRESAGHPARSHTAMPIAAGTCTSRLMIDGREEHEPGGRPESSVPSVPVGPSVPLGDGHPPIVAPGHAVADRPAEAHRLLPGSTPTGHRGARAVPHQNSVHRLHDVGVDEQRAHPAEHDDDREGERHELRQVDGARIGRRNSFAKPRRMASQSAPAMWPPSSGSSGMRLKTKSAMFSDARMPTRPAAFRGDRDLVEARDLAATRPTPTTEIGPLGSRSSGRTRRSRRRPCAAAGSG